MVDLATALRAILPSGVGLGGCQPGAALPLWAGEQIGAAVPKRVAEFSAGRTAARRALTDGGLSAAAIPVQANRAPLWPFGVVGSISHCDGACLAVAGSAADWQGLGLDIEPDQGLSHELWPEILRDEEILALGQHPDTHRDRLALRVFVAKEATYKAQFAITEQVFDFQTLTITLRGDAFSARFETQVAPFGNGETLHGHFASADGFLAAFCAIPA